MSLRVGDIERPRAGHRYLTSSVPAIIDTIRLEWDALDAWYGEDEQVFVHLRNPCVRVDVLRSGRPFRIELDSGPRRVFLAADGLRDPVCQLATT